MAEIAPLNLVPRVYLPTFSEIKAWDFYPGSAGIFEYDTIISKEVRRLPKTSEVFRRRLKSAEGEVIESQS